MRNFQVAFITRLPRLTFVALLLLILTGAVVIAQQNSEAPISSIHGTYHPAPAHRATPIRKSYKPIVYVVRSYAVDLI